MDDVIPFTNLMQALDFLATHLDGQRYDVILDACLEGESTQDSESSEDEPSEDESSLGRDYQLDVIKVLGVRHQQRDLRERYQGKAFPDDADAFTIGSHNDGHVHVEFVRVERGWRLREIWLCR
jgi:hypothetical protein